MKDLFDVDNPVWRLMGKVGDLIILNILAFVCSIPIVTIGASWTALYYVTMRMVKKKEGYVAKEFFHSFKENFRQATAIWLITLLIIVIFCVDIIICRSMSNQISDILLVVVGFVAFIVFGTVSFVFPLLARFENTVKNTIRNAFLLSIANVPYTVLFILFIAAPIVLAIYFMQAVPLVILLGISMPAYLFSMLLIRTFKKLEPVEETDEGAVVEGTEE